MSGAIDEMVYSKSRVICICHRPPASILAALYYYYSPDSKRKRAFTTDITDLHFEKTGGGQLGDRWRQEPAAAAAAVVTKREVAFVVLFVSCRMM
jgi:hypothetical protein